MLKREYRLLLHFEGPLLTHAVGTLAFGLDAAMQRYQGRPVIGGTLVRGNLRHALEGFAEMLAGDPEGPLLEQAVRRWFGNESGEGEYEPRRAAVDFDMFWKLAGEGTAPGRHRHRVAINTGTGTAEARALLAIEDTFGAGSAPAFSGAIHARFEDEGEAEDFERWTQKAIEYIAAMGALKGVGHGRLAGAELTRLERVWRFSKHRPRPLDTDRLGILLHLNQPFCITRPQTPDSNVLEGEAVIPGGLIKAVMARTLGGDSTRLNELLAFDKLIVTHALPAKIGAPRRGTALPLSLAAFEGEVRDLALEERPVLRKASGSLPFAPAFRPDWKEKDRKAAEARFGDVAAQPGRYLHVRTAIDSKTGIAKEAALFSQDCVDPAGHVWCADIELGGIEDPAERRRVRENLLALFDREELTGIGKTKARARVEPHPAPFSSARRPEALARDRFVVLLRTPARLLPSRLANATAIDSDGYLHEKYARYWSYASEGCLALSHYFARQRRAGGMAYWKYYRKDDERYAPEWLTEAGSVFVVRAAGDLEAAASWLEGCSRFGLPPAEDRAGDGWRTDPYRPENGYGEVVVNHPAQLRLIEEKEEEEKGQAVEWEPVVYERL